MPEAVQAPMPIAGAATPIQAAPAPAAPVSPSAPLAGAAPPSDWREALPPSVRSWNEVTEAKSAEQFWQDMTNQRGLAGQSVRVPSEHAGPEDWAAYADKQNQLAPGRFMVKPDRGSPEQMAAFNRSMGVPDAAEGYHDVANDTYQENELQVAGAFKNIAHNNGLTPEQYSGVVTDYMELLRLSAAEARQPVDDAIATLKGEWGAAFEERTGKGAAIMEKFGFHPDAVSAFKAGTADAQSMKAIYAMAEAIGTEGMNLTEQQTINGTPAMTPMEATSRADEIRNGPRFNSDIAAERMAAGMELVELQKFISPDTANEELVFQRR